MSENWLSFSEQIGELTQEEIDWLNQVMLCEDDSKADNPARKAFFENRTERPEYWECFPDFQFDVNEKEKTFWFYSEEHANVDHLVAVIEGFIKKFRPTAVFGFTYAETCSKMYIGEFSGGAVVISAQKTVWMNAIDWVGKEVKRLKKKVDPYKKGM